MSILQVGVQAPAFTLPDVNGESHSLAAHAAPLTLALFFKTTCPTCQYAWPYYERLHQAYGDAGLRVLGISQHDADRTKNYQRDYSASFPHLIDRDFAASRAYDPDFLPTAFLIQPDGTIRETFVSWNSERLNATSTHIAAVLGTSPQQIVRREDHAIASKLG